ncbi:hypothetical protein SynSYN20_02524 [Synechococcus sp. SYN20]|nr:hypothetical protein SynSYN20_02524 [Synechococcus sp. SYN20]
MSNNKPLNNENTVKRDNSLSTFKPWHYFFTTTNIKDI